MTGKYVKASDVLEYVKTELWRRRGDRYEIVSFDDMRAELYWCPHCGADMRGGEDV